MTIGTLKGSNEDWKDLAKCRGMDISLFFERYEESTEVQLKVDSICNSCPVQAECYAFAVENKLEGGVFGKRYIQPKHKARNKKR